MQGSLSFLAQAAAPAPRAGLGDMLPMILIFGIMFVWMYRAQKKEKNKRESMLSAIKVGDKVITAGGIKGEVTVVKESSYMVKIAEKVIIEITKAGVGTVLIEEKEALGEGK